MAAWSQLQRRLWAIPNRGSRGAGKEGRTLNVRMGFMGIFSVGWLHSGEAPTMAPEYWQASIHRCEFCHNPHVQRDMPIPNRNLDRENLSAWPHLSLVS